MYGGDFEETLHARARALTNTRPTFSPSHLGLYTHEGRPISPQGTTVQVDLVRSGLLHSAVHVTVLQTYNKLVIDGTTTVETGDPSFGLPTVLSAPITCHQCPVDSVCYEGDWGSEHYYNSTGDQGQPCLRCQAYSDDDHDGDRRDPACWPTLEKALRVVDGRTLIVGGPRIKPSNPGGSISGVVRLSYIALMEEVVSNRLDSNSLINEADEEVTEELSQCQLNIPGAIWAGHQGTEDVAVVVNTSGASIVVCAEMKATTLHSSHEAVSKGEIHTRFSFPPDVARLGSDLLVTFSGLPTYDTRVPVEITPSVTAGSLEDVPPLTSCSSSSSPSSSSSSRKTYHAHVSAFVEEDTAEQTKCFYIKLKVPRIEQSPEVTKKQEVIVVVDRSGSMEGAKMTQTRHALQLLLHSLRRGCTFFDVVSFGSSFSHLFEQCAEYTATNLETATKHVDQMNANMGATELLEPLAHILERPVQNGALRYVIIITDGYIGKSIAVMEKIERHCSVGDTFVFALGIGSDCSHATLLDIAAKGRGITAFVSDSKRVEPKVMLLVNALLGELIMKPKITWPLQSSNNNPPYFEKGTKPIPFGHKTEFWTVINAKDLRGEVVVCTGSINGREKITLTITPKVLIGSNKILHHCAALVASRRAHVFYRTPADNIETRYGLWTPNTHFDLPHNNETPFIRQLQLYILELSCGFQLAAGLITSQRDRVNIHDLAYIINILSNKFQSALACATTEERRNQVRTVASSLHRLESRLGDLTSREEREERKQHWISSHGRTQSPIHYVAVISMNGTIVAEHIAPEMVSMKGQLQQSAISNHFKHYVGTGEYSSRLRDGVDIFCKRVVGGTLVCIGEMERSVAQTLLQESLIPTQKVLQQFTVHSLQNAGIFGKEASGNVLLKYTNVTVSVTGDLCMCTQVEQCFVNEDKVNVEAVYVLPLPPTAVVVSFSARYDDGTLVMAKCVPATDALRTYDDAIASGHSPQLLEQASSGVFRISIGNLLPKKNIMLCVSFVQELELASPEKGSNFIFLNLSVPGSLWACSSSPNSPVTIMMTVDSHPKSPITEFGVSQTAPPEIFRNHPTPLSTSFSWTGTTKSLNKGVQIRARYNPVAGIGWIAHDPKNETSCVAFVSYANLFGSEIHNIELSFAPAPEFKTPLPLSVSTSKHHQTMYAIFNKTQMDRLEKVSVWKYPPGSQTALFDLDLQRCESPPQWPPVLHCCAIARGIFTNERESVIREAVKYGVACDLTSYVAVTRNTVSTQETPIPVLVNQVAPLEKIFSVRKWQSKFCEESMMYGSAEFEPISGALHSCQDMLKSILTDVKFSDANYGSSSSTDEQYEILHKVCTQQNVDGFWTSAGLSSALGTLNTSISGLIENIPESLQTHDTGTCNKGDLWATCLAVAFLELYLPKLRAQWKFIARKAVSWLQSQSIDKTLLANLLAAASPGPHNNPHVPTQQTPTPPPSTITTSTETGTTTPTISSCATENSTAADTSQLSRAELEELLL
ncbi:von Willebrand factor type A domain [Pelomyxa schiedti]|nr:von Willebrand factor type A domain [Pelomyxa schiedti]